jgi:hypothetical protein
LSRPTVEIRTVEGKTYSCTPDGMPGDPDHSVSDAMLQAKFRDCISFSASDIPPANVERLIAMIWDLEKVGNVAEIAGLLVP